MTETEMLPADAPQSMMRAKQILSEGGLVAFPTDTVYGLGAEAFDPRAITKLYEAKERSPSKAVPILIAEAEALEQLAEHVPEAAVRLADRYWPGPLTIVLQRSASLPDELGPGDTIGLRIPDHPTALALLRAAGPLAVSSANISGQPSVRTAEQVRETLSGRIELILDGGQTPGGVPSTVVDCLSRQPAVLRAGPISRYQILQALGS